MRVRMYYLQHVLELQEPRTTITTPHSVPDMGNITPAYLAGIFDQCGEVGETLEYVSIKHDDYEFIEMFSMMFQGYTQWEDDVFTWTPKHPFRFLKLIAPHLIDKRSLAIVLLSKQSKIYRT